MKLKMFKFENDIMLLLVGGIFLFRREVQMMGQCFRFPLLVPRAIGDDKLEFKQG
jgi:hypothetical protein